MIFFFFFFFVFFFFFFFFLEIQVSSKPCSSGDDKDYGPFFRWLGLQALSVYQGSELRNNFFLLHGVTASWALGQIFSRIGGR